jgi:phosphatidylserine/phosphatidylglycerophosphate/cardiolipin synthase-like enzyme
MTDILPIVLIVLNSYNFLLVNCSFSLQLIKQAKYILPISRKPDQDQSTADPFQVFWGGPGYPSRTLRDLLEKRIHNVPSGGEILWVTYYFRDEELAQALLQAYRRGVRVRVVMEGNPRTGAINSRVRKLLQGKKALGNNLRALSHRLIDNRYLRNSRLHEKLYYFSHPIPSVLVGTFNPSGNLPEDPDVIHKIGDQDRGHNVLVDIRETTLVQGLHKHAQRLFGACHGPWERFLPENNRVISSGRTRVLFFPRSKWADFYELFDGLGAGSTLRIAVSHLNDRGICKLLFGLAQRGVHIQILAHDTQRRVPSWVEEQMLQNGIDFHRYVHPEGFPMHNKFMLIDTRDRQVLTFGSMNLSVRSLRANHELLVIDETPDLYQAFQQRWDEMQMEVRSCQKSAGLCGPKR